MCAAMPGYRDTKKRTQASSKAKAKAKAKADSSKKQKTSGAEWSEGSEDITAIVPAFDMGLQFHKGVTKMRALLKYRASEKCVKACLNNYIYIYIFIYLDMQPFRETY